ncbi:N-acetylmuramoyl-L-alanine amidase-like domain-containing protein [Aureibacter tunicatorum]|uniref:DUF1460 domain-containing protein n=1 Tax=Aureibacter tunicatorum TaxID=866807 RepID=A0AAE3XMR2_9BACT|nr:N-acetylmuramoyl-L-alanine amidase-like domain-containing protein [Aureibacter tunicatorum]MDR6237859.1 hypothetical protein [Aureibacter tunicatorum]
MTVHKLLTFLFIFISAITSACSQSEITGNSESILNKKIAEIQGQNLKSDSLVLTVGKSFIGTPYVSQTLERPKEILVVNLEELDCTTYLETVLAISNTVKSESSSIKTYESELTKIRYRSGQLAGYSSRLHYFTDWLIDNEKKGTLRILSDNYGEKYDKEINFMSTHADAYEGLKSESDLEDIRKAENLLNSQEIYFIPKEKLSEIESNIKSGDILGFTTHITGLDVSHVGFAIVINKQVHVMHASLKNGVIISDKTLAEFIAPDRYTGIMLARPINQ